MANLPPSLVVIELTGSSRSPQAQSDPTAPLPIRYASRLTAFPENCNKKAKFFTSIVETLLKELRSFGPLFLQRVSG